MKTFKEKFENGEYKPLGPKSAKFIRRINVNSAKNYEPYPFVVVKTKGPWLYDPDGNKALDFLAAYSSILTHRNKSIIKAVTHELKKGSDLTSRALYDSKFADFVEKVSELTGYQRVMPKSDGGSATDSAITALFRHGSKRGIKKPEVILTKDYFHGRTIVFGSNADFDKSQSYLLNQKYPGIKVVNHTPKAVEEAVNENTIGIFVEPHKGEGGPLFTTKEDFIAMRKIAKDKGIFFVVDEIQTGLGRCGYMMAWQEFGGEARPDAVTLGKALGGGVIPVSAVIGTEEFMDIYKPGVDGSTHGGYSIACAAACASLDYIVENNICEKAKEIGNYFANKLRGIQGINTDHRGALIRVEIERAETTKYACLEMLVGDRNPRVFMKHGHSAVRDGKQVAFTRIAPPIGAMTKDLIDEAVDKTIGPVLREAATQTYLP